MQNHDAVRRDEKEIKNRYFINLSLNLVSTEDGEEWIKKNVKDEDPKKVLESYHNAYDILARQRLGTVMKQAKWIHPSKTKQVEFDRLPSWPV